MALSNKIGKRNGFTLIELLVSMSILVFITAIFLASYHNTSKRSELNNVIQKAASDIRLAQNYSLGGKEYAPGVYYNWGVYFKNNTANYILFADKNNNQRYDSSFDISQTINLPTGITISAIGCATDGSFGSKVEIVFVAPDPITYIGEENDETVCITFKENIKNTTARIFVNYFGLIDTFY